MKSTKTLTLSAVVFAVFVIFQAVAFASDSGKKAFLGITPAEVTSDIAQDYGVENGKGVLIEGVVSDSPADKVGLRENDILLKLGGEILTGPEELRVQLKKHKKGDSVELVYLRGGKEKSSTVELSGSGDEDSRYFGYGSDGWSWGDSKSKKKEKKSAFAGIVTQELSKGLADYFKVKNGVLISEVVKESPAEKAGLKPGDILTKIGSENIEDRNDVYEAVRDHKPGEKVDFTFYRDGQQQTIAVELGEKDSDWFGMIESPEDPDSPQGFQFHVSPEGETYNFDDGELHRMHIDLEKLHQELKNIPQIDIQVPDIPGKKDIKVKVIDGKSSRSVWKYSWKELQGQFGLQLDQLKDDLTQLQDELKRLSEELKQKLS